MTERNVGKYLKLTLLDTQKIYFQRFFTLRSLQLISNGLKEVNINLLKQMWLCFKLLRSLFSEDSQPIDFINLNVVGQVVNSIDRINRKQGTQSKQFSVQSIKIISYYLNVTNLLIILLIFIFLSCREKAPDNKVFCHENSRPDCKARITTWEVEPYMHVKNLLKGALEY